MNKGIWTIAGCAATLCAALIAAPGYTAAQRSHQAENQEVVEPQVRDFDVLLGEVEVGWASKPGKSPATTPRN
jgi:hypothetical protein